MILGIKKKDHLAELQRPKLCLNLGVQLTGDGLFMFVNPLALLIVSNYLVQGFPRY